MSIRYYIGTSGWVYPHWKHIFYPSDLPQSRWLEYYTQHFKTVELNNTFYRLPNEKTFDNWHDRCPGDFRYAVKASRFITHIKKLNDIDEPLETFLNRARRLRGKLGPVLYQLPPGQHRNDDKLETFISLLPGDIKHVLEFRHESWLDDRVFAIMSKHNVGLCVFDMPGLTCPITATADFGYIRFHGSGGMYSGCYSDSELEDWSVRISELSKKLDEVYIYFNNDADGHAIGNARTLRQMLGNN